MGCFLEKILQQLAYPLAQSMTKKAGSEIRAGD
jgi:hypothetical protein